MTLEFRISLRGRCGFRSKEKGQGGLFLPNQLGSGNMTCSPAALLARCPLAYPGRSFQLTGPGEWQRASEKMALRKRGGLCTQPFF